MDGSASPDSHGKDSSPGPPDKERDLEQKRARGEISCAECRRQKLKCDKKIPCSSCIRRGCQSVCPTGLLSSRHKASSKTEKLQKKVHLMSKRIQQLENALQVLQACVSSAPHPLLDKELLEMKNPEMLDDMEKPPDNTEADLHIDFGSLTICEQGATHFVGRSGVEMLMATVSNESVQEIKQKVYSKLPPEVKSVSETFPFTPMQLRKEGLFAVIESRLPSYDRATALIEAYLQNTSSLFRPIKRDQILEELVPMFYKRRDRDARKELPISSEIVTHQLALLLAVFACGAAGDLTQETCNEEGETYKQLAQCALSLYSVFEGTSLATVQALALMGAYDLYSASVQTVESAFKLLGLAHCLGITIGLHWEPSTWKIDPKLVERRRNLFWELFSIDALKSVTSGRPMMLRLDEIYCQYPEDEEEQTLEDGTKTHGYWRWKYESIAKISTEVTGKLCSARPMKYSDILELDRKVRLSHRGACGGPQPGDSPSYSFTPLQQCIRTLHGDAVLLFIHRNFFIMALRESPKDPLHSRFSFSFLATFSCAVNTLRYVRRDYEGSIRLLLRHWTLWAVALAAGVVVGSVAATQRGTELFQTAFYELQSTIELFEKAIAHPVSKNGLPILLRLRSKALSNLNADSSSNVKYKPISQMNVKTEEVDEALSLIGGTAHAVHSEQKLQDAKRFATSLSALAPDMHNKNPDDLAESTGFYFNRIISHIHSPTQPPPTAVVDHTSLNTRTPPLASSSTNGPHASVYHNGTNGQTRLDPHAHYQGGGFGIPDPQGVNMLVDPNFLTSIPGLDHQHAGSLDQYTANVMKQPFIPDPSSFPMNVDASNLDFDVGWLASGNLPPLENTAAGSQTTDIDLMIEDTWRTIMGDPRFTNTGVSEPALQF